MEHRHAAVGPNYCAVLILALALLWAPNCLGQPVRANPVTTNSLDNGSTGKSLIWGPSGKPAWGDVSSTNAIPTQFWNTNAAKSKAISNSFVGPVEVDGTLDVRSTNNGPAATVTAFYNNIPLKLVATNSTTSAALGGTIPMFFWDFQTDTNNVYFQFGNNGNRGSLHINSAHGAGDPATNASATEWVITSPGSVAIGMGAANNKRRALQIGIGPGTPALPSTQWVYRQDNVTPTAAAPNGWSVADTWAATGFGVAGGSKFPGIVGRWLDTNGSPGEYALDFFRDIGRTTSSTEDYWDLTTLVPGFQMRGGVSNAFFFVGTMDFTNITTGGTKYWELANGQNTFYGVATVTDRMKVGGSGLATNYGLQVGMPGGFGSVATFPQVIAFPYISSGTPAPNYVGGWNSSGYWGIGAATANNDMTVRIGAVDNPGPAQAWNSSAVTLYVNGTVAGSFVGNGSGITNLGNASLPGNVLTNFESQASVMTNTFSVSNNTFAAGVQIGTNGTINASGAIRVLSTRYPTNTSTMAPDFNLKYSKISTNASFTFLLPINTSASEALTTVILVTNSAGAGSPITASFPVSVTNIGTASMVITQLSSFTFFQYGKDTTNGFSTPIN